MDCYACDRPATNACKRCAKPYCEDHGNATFCAECLQPASALPSFNLYRVALLLMLVGTAVAIFLLVRPPGDTGTAAPVIVGRSAATATSGAGAEATATGEAGEPPQSAGSETAVSATTTVTPAASGTAGTTPTATGTASPFNEYVVVEGDSLYGIASRLLPPGDDVDAFARAIATLNRINYDDPVLRVGATILLPKPP